MQILEAHIKRALLLYPSVFPNRWAVLHHWFAVNGNGLKWEKGKLVDINPKPFISVEEAITLATINHDMGVESYKGNLIEKAMTKFYKDELVTDLNRINNWEKSIKDMTPREELYPLCRFAKMCNIPDNIHPEWLEAIKEFCNSLSTVDKTDEDLEWLYLVHSRTSHLSKN